MRRLERELVVTVIAVLVAMAVGSLLVLAYGRSPMAVYGLMLRESWGSLDGVTDVAFRAGPLILTGLAVAVAFRAGLFNIGAEGQAVAGAFAAAVVGTHMGGVPVGLAALVCLVVAMLVGGGAGALPGALKARFGVHEVISTMMLNFILVIIIKQLGTDHFYAFHQEHTVAIAASARLPALGDAAGGARGFGVAGLLALAAAGAVAWLFARTRVGFELRALGASPAAAEAAGVRPGRAMVIAMALSGALAGLTAGGLVLGYKGYFQADLVTGYGFMGIAVALLGRSRPLGVVLAALLLATLARGGVAAATMVPRELVDVLQATLILAVAAVTAVGRRLPEVGAGDAEAEDPGAGAEAETGTGTGTGDGVAKAVH